MLADDVPELESDVLPDDESCRFASCWFIPANVLTPDPPV